MSYRVRLEHHSGIAVISLDNPPVNALDATVRAGVQAALHTAADDAAVQAIVICANGAAFSAGGDISEFGKPSQEPHLSTLCDQIEACEKPVIAAMHGTVFGGGLEVAIACHYRICDPHTVMGFPEIKLGLLPGAGGTQRAPRLIGAGPSLDMMLSGVSIDAADGLDLGMVDRVDDTNTLRAAAIALAREVVPFGPRPTTQLSAHMQESAAYMAVVARQRLDISQGSFAQTKIVACVEAALILPPDAGRMLERQAFEACLNTYTAKGLRHLFFAERRAAKFPETGRARAVSSVAVIGGNHMGAGIAAACMNAGLPVTIVEENEASVSAAIDRIGPIYETAVAHGVMSETAATDALARMALTTRIEDIASADLVIETGPDDMGTKGAVLELIAGHAKTGAIIATNTSRLDVATLAALTGRAADVVGLHFFAPAHVVKLVEVVATPNSDAGAVLGLRAFAKRIGKFPVRVMAKEGCVGLIGDRLLNRLRHVCDTMLVDGATPEQIDVAMCQIGFAKGPYQIIDRLGLDVVLAQQRAMAPSQGRQVALAEQMCQVGWLGRKTGRGYYVYDKEGKVTRINPDIIIMLSKLRSEKGIVSRQFSAKNILDRMVLALINEAALMMVEGIVTHPSDIDVVSVHGLGYPRARGGPLQDADILTSVEVHRRITQLAQNDPSLWTVAPLLGVLASERKCFAQLNLN